MPIKVLKYSALLVLLVLLYPPWNQVACPGADNCMSQEIGFGPLWAPPTDDLRSGWTPRINYGRLGVEVVAAALAGLLLGFADSRRRGTPPTR